MRRLTNEWFFPIGTFTVNMVGCLLIGLLAQVAADKGFRTEFQLFVFVGLLGGFTTFSSFGLETMQLFRDGQIVAGLFNAVLQVVIGLAFVAVGAWLGKLVGPLLT